MKYKHIIWDWNGTLFCDMQACINTVNDMMPRFNVANKVTSLKQYRDIFTFPVVNYYKELGFDIDNILFDDIAKDYIYFYTKYMNKCNLFDGVEEVLKTLHDNHVSQMIVSAAGKESLMQQINMFDIINYFDDIQGLDNNYAHSKAHIAKDYIESHDINVNELLVIGDTLHDYEVAATLGCDCILISNGHQSKEVLQQSNTKIINSIKELIGEIQ